MSVADGVVPRRKDTAARHLADAVSFAAAAERALARVGDRIDGRDLAEVDRVTAQASALRHRTAKLQRTLGAPRRVLSGRLDLERTG